MSKYTASDLRTMQAWSLERKIQVTQAKILEWYKKYDGQVFISFSGGKDSTVLLDLVRRVYDDIPAVFVDTGLEYPELREFVKTIPNVEWLRPKYPFYEIIEKYGYPVISKDVSGTIYGARKGQQSRILRLNGTWLDKAGNKSRYNCEQYRYMLDAPFKISDKCCYYMKKAPMRSYERQTGRKGILGTMACESQLRLQSWLWFGCNAFEATHPSSRPMSFWMEQDVLRYLQITGIPYASVYGEIEEVKTNKGIQLRTTGLHRTGCMFCMYGVHLEETPNRFQKMQMTHPKQYDYCINKLGCGKVLDFIGVPYTNETEEKIREATEKYI